MNGPFPLNEHQITLRVTRTAPGAYKLSHSRAAIRYVGRSDMYLNSRLKSYVGAYRYFWYEYATSPKSAFDKECNLWRHYGGVHGALDNINHPARPAGSHWKCPKCKIFG